MKLQAAGNPPQPSEAPSHYRASRYELIMPVLHALRSSCQPQESRQPCALHVHRQTPPNILNHETLNPKVLQPQSLSAPNPEPQKPTRNFVNPKPSPSTVNLSIHKPRTSMLKLLIAFPRISILLQRNHT